MCVSHEDSDINRHSLPTKSFCCLGYVIVEDGGGGSDIRHKGVSKAWGGSCLLLTLCLSLWHNVSLLSMSSGLCFVVCIWTKVIECSAYPSPWGQCDRDTHTNKQPVVNVSDVIVKAGTAWFCSGFITHIYTLERTDPMMR